MQLQAGCCSSEESRGAWDKAAEAAGRDAEPAGLPACTAAPQNLCPAPKTVTLLVPRVNPRVTGGQGGAVCAAPRPDGDTRYPGPRGGRAPGGSSFPGPRPGAGGAAEERWPRRPKDAAPALPGVSPASRAAP